MTTPLSRPKLNPKRAELSLLVWLTDTDALRDLIREGLHEQYLPTEELRPVLSWASERLSLTDAAPPVALMTERWPDLAGRYEVNFDDEPVDGPLDVLYVLRDNWARAFAQEFSLKIADQASAATPEELSQTLFGLAGEFIERASMLQPTRSHVDMRDSALEMLATYDRIAASGNPARGLTFGLPGVDAVTLGTWPGEVTCVMAPPKQKKSWFADLVAYESWYSDQPCALITLENTITATELRMACIATGSSITNLQSGRLTPEEYDRLKTWIHDVLRKSDVPLHIMSPELGLRTPAAMVEQARNWGCDRIIVDQLSHAEVVVDRGRSRADEIFTLMNGLSRAVKAGRNPMSCLLIHQMNRAGIERLETEKGPRARDAADGSSVEKFVDLQLALYASEEDQKLGFATLEVVAARRIAPGWKWDLNWHVDIGKVSVRRVLDPDALPL